MYPKPIDELKMLESLPGFDELNDDEKILIHSISFKYGEYSVLTTARVVFIYGEFKMKFEMSCFRQDGSYYHHILYEDYHDEIEFPSFRKAVDYCNQKYE